MNVVILAGVLAVLVITAWLCCRSQVRYLRHQAEGKDGEERDQLFRDYLQSDPGGAPGPF